MCYGRRKTCVASGDRPSVSTTPCTTSTTSSRSSTRAPGYPVLNTMVKSEQMCQDSSVQSRYVLLYHFANNSDLFSSFFFSGPFGDPPQSLGGEAQMSERFGSRLCASPIFLERFGTTGGRFGNCGERFQNHDVGRAHHVL